MGLFDLAFRLPRPVKDAIKDRVYPDLLGEGETAPEWQLQAVGGEWFSQGAHWTLMAFVSGDLKNPAMREWLTAIQKNSLRLNELGCHPVLLNPAGPDTLESLGADLGLTFPLLTDSGATVANQFQAVLQLPSGPMMIPTLYLVNPQRKIRLSNRGMPSIAAVVRSIEALQQATRQGM